MSEAIETLNKLFDTLKDASNRNEAATEKLVDQQLELVTHIKTMPVAELRSALKDHALKSEQDIQDCNGTIELKTADIMEEIKKLSAKVTKMIIVVSVAFAVATAGYFLIRYAAEKSTPSPNWEDRLQQIENDQHDDFDKRLDQLSKELRDEMQRLHDEGKQDESIHN